MARHVVIVGGGLAGLLTAYAFLGHVDRVTVIEQTRYPQQPEFGGGIPQGRHVHVLISGGQRILDELMPGIMAALRSAGARDIAMPRDILVHTRTGWHHRFPEGRFSLVSSTRPTLDHVVRARVLAEAETSPTEIEILQGTQVTSLLGTPQRITGVAIRRRGGGAVEDSAEDVAAEDSAVGVGAAGDGAAGEGAARNGAADDLRTEEMAADLVVDASGRRSRAPRWLDELGARRAKEDRLDARLAYATRLYRFAEEPEAAVNITSTPACPRGGVLMPVERGQWLLTLSGFGGDSPATDEDAFLDHAARLGHPYLWELMQSAEPLSPVFGFADTSNRRRRYDEKGAAPDGFFAVGDALCAFNPLYGQGMTVAAAHASAVRATLGRRPVGAGFSADAQRAVSRKSVLPWLYTTSADRQYLDPSESRTRGLDRLAYWYTDRLIDHVAVDNTVGEALRGVFALALPPTRVISPGVTIRTLRRPKPSLPNPPSAYEGIRS